MYPDSWWNYRVVRSVVKREESEDGEEYFGVYECFYTSKNPDVPDSWVECPAVPQGDTLEELKADLTLMQEALKRPILEIVGEEGEDERALMRAVVAGLADIDAGRELSVAEVKERLDAG